MSSALDCTNLTTKIPCTLSLEINNNALENADAFLKLESNNCKNACEFIKAKISINNSVIKDELLSKIIHKEIGIGSISKNSMQEIYIEYSLIENAPDNLQKSSLGIEYFTGLQRIDRNKQSVEPTTITKNVTSSQSGTVSGVTQTIHEPIHQSMAMSFHKELIIILVCLIILFVFFIRIIFYTYKKCFEDSH